VNRLLCWLPWLAAAVPWLCIGVRGLPGGDDWQLEIARVVLGALAILTNMKRPQPVLWLLVAVLAFTLSALAYRVRNFTEDTVYIHRNYYGVLRVKENQSRADDLL